MRDSRPAPVSTTSRPPSPSNARPSGFASPDATGTAGNAAALLGPAIDVRVNLGGAALWAGGGAVFGVAAGADVLARAERPGGAVDRLRRCGRGRHGPLGGADSGAWFAPHLSDIAGVEHVLADTSVFLEARGELVLPIGDPMFGFVAGRIGVKFSLGATVATEP